MKTYPFFVLPVLLVVQSAEGSVRVVPSSRSSALLKAQSARFDAQINAPARMARVTETWVYENDAPQNFEAELVCEAPKNALMTGFAYWYRGEKVVARVVEKTRAANIYAAANPLAVPVAQRRDPALAEKLAPNLLKVRIGPVDAKKPLKIELQFLQPLDEAGNSLELPIVLRDEVPLSKPLQKFDFNVAGVASGQQEWVGGFSPHSDKKIDLPQSAKLKIRAPQSHLLLQSAPKNGFFAAVVNESQWKMRDSWKGVEQIASKVLDAKRILVAGKFRATPPAKALNARVQTDPFVPRMLWMALQIETLEKNPNNYSQVLALSKASNLPSAFSSWLAIPNSERKALADIIDPNRRWRVRRDYSRLGYALAGFKAVGKTRTPQYREMLAQFNRLRREDGQDHYASRPLEEFERDYASSVLNSALQRYASSTKDLSGAKLSAFAVQFKRLNYGPHDAITEARETLAARRANERILRLVQSGKPVTVASIKIPRLSENNYKARHSILNTLAKQSVAVRAKNPARAKQLETVLRGVATKIGGDVNSTLQSAEYENEPRYYAIQGALTKSILAKQENTPEGIKALREWEALVARNQFLGREGLGLTGEIGKLYVQAQRERWQETPDTAKIDRLEVERERLLRLSQANAKAVEYAQQSALRSETYGTLPDLIAEETLKNGPDTLRAQTLEKEWRALHPGNDTYYLKAAEIKILNKTAQPLMSAYFEARADENAAKVASIETQIKELQVKSRFNKTYFTDVLAQSFAVETQRILEARIRAEARKDSPDMAQLDLLTARLAKTIEQSDREQTWANWTYRRFWSTPSDTQKRGTALDYARLKTERMGVQEKLAIAAKKAEQAKDAPLATRQKAENEVAQLKQLENQLRVRMGDPLVAVKAPQTARQVLAIFPGGELKKLEWNAQTSQWEARFDVPTWATEGDYAVQIVVVFQSGSRQKLTMHFAVDLQAPGGVAGLKSDGKIWHLKLETDDLTDRVSAFLPWNERVELRRDAGGAFAAQVALPHKFEAQKGAVRFIVTDKAHNRTEILVDWE